MKISFPFTTPALRVQQPLGSFYVAVLPAALLLQVCNSDRMRAKMSPGGSGYKLEGAQRVIQDKRLEEIAAYINRVDASFPNSVILAANHNFETGFDQGEFEDIQGEKSHGLKNSSKAWSVSEAAESRYMLSIPSAAKVAAVIDGRDRLFSFAKAEKSALEATELLCSVFIDLPKAFQAQIFATINSTQKRVDRSLTYELFGYNIAEEQEDLWTPDKLAVFLCRKLATEKGSPLQGRIALAPKLDENLQGLANSATWQVSTAVVVDGILRLFSTNPGGDANLMRTGKARPRSILKSERRDKSPLREVYLDGNDLLIFQMVLNYLTAANAVFWKSAPSGSLILKTIGVQAIFDVLRRVAPESLEEKDIRVQYFQSLLAPAGKIDFADKEFKNFSGSGRIYIRKAIEQAMGIG